MGKRKIYCVCCNNEISEDMLEDIWRSDEGLFCNQDCIASWYGDQDLADEDYKVLVKEYGRDR